MDRKHGSESKKHKQKQHYYNSSLIVTRAQSNDKHHRLINKNGVCNVKHPRSKLQKFIIFRYSKLVDYSWTYTISVFLTILCISWICFAIAYWLICNTHGDFEPNHLPEFQKDNNFKPCIYDVRNFASCLLFSMEAQHTVGYGIKAPTDECPEVIFVNSIHCIIGFIMQGFMAAIFFSKMTRPRLRSHTLIFSKKAVISQRNGKLCFMFRIGDIRIRHIVEAKVKAFLIRNETTQEGEILMHRQIELVIYSDGCISNHIFFNWPLVLYHVIDETSPLYYIAPNELNEQKFEIMVIIEGIDENIGQVTQARTSYMPNEILWGYTFVTLFRYDNLRNEYEVDYSKFDLVKPISTPLCSAAYCKNYNSMQSKAMPSHINLDFTPRQSIGEIPQQTLKKLAESQI